MLEQCLTASLGRGELLRRKVSCIASILPSPLFASSSLLISVLLHLSHGIPHPRAVHILHCTSGGGAGGGVGGARDEGGRGGSRGAAAGAVPAWWAGGLLAPCADETRRPFQLRLIQALVDCKPGGGGGGVFGGNNAHFNVCVIISTGCISLPFTRSFRVVSGPLLAV